MAAKKQTSNVRMARKDRVASILKTARIHLAAVGYERFSPMEVAQQCGVSEATIYRYFASRHDLLVQVAECWLEELLAEAPNLTEKGSVFERLRQVVWYSLWVIQSEPVLSKFILMVIRSDPDFKSSNIYLLNKKFTGYTKLVVEDAIAQGVFRSDVSPSFVRNMVFGTIEHQVWSYLRGEGEFYLDDCAQLITEIVFRGLAVEPTINLEVFNHSMMTIEKNVKEIDAALKLLKT